MAKKENYSVKEEIEKALVNLLAEKPYMDITVTDLVTKAKVARVSFYRHFSSISDVIDSIAEKTADLFSTEIIPPINSGDERKWREFLFFYFYRVSQNSKEFMVAGTTNNNPLSSRLSAKVGVILQNQPEPTMQEAYSWIGKLCLLQGISQTWVAGGMQETPEEMIDYVMSIIIKF